MKKLLSIIVLGLLLSGNAYAADENKWKVGENYLTAKCFIYEWTSSDNFKDYYKKYYPSVEKRYSSLLKDMSPKQRSDFFFQSIGKFFSKSIPINDKFEASWGGDQLSLTTNLNDCSSKQDFEIDKTVDFYNLIDESLVYKSKLSLDSKCIMFAPDVIITAKAKCLDVRTIGYTTVYTGGTMPNYTEYNTYGVFELNNEKIILPLKFNVSLIEIKEDPKVLRNDFFSWLSSQDQYSNMNQLLWDEDFEIYINQTYTNDLYRNRIKDSLNGPPNFLKYYDNRRYLSGSACKQSQCITKTLVWFDTNEEKSIALIHDGGFETKPELTIVSYDYKELPEFFITAVKDWMIEQEIREPKKINLKYKDNKIEVLKNNIFN
jgi:hypothetical protein